MLAAITHPAGVEAGAGEAVEKIILPSRQQSAAERLAVYSSAYFARLLDVLHELFPCLRFAVGNELFDQFAVSYLRAHPPQSYTLHALADRFAEHLESSRPAGEAWSAFVVDLARLEHAIDQVFDGPGPEGLEPGPLLADENGPLRLAPGLRLLALRFPVSTYFTSWKADQRPAWPPPGEQFVALLRRDYVVRRYELSRPQFELLSWLAAGHSLADSLAEVAQQLEPADIQRWFTVWAAEQFFIADP
jgi:hypothetical protein